MQQTEPRTAEKLALNTDPNHSMTPKPFQRFNAIRIDPGNYGKTGYVEYTSKGTWRFWPDDPDSMMQNLARGEFRIPSLDQVGLPATHNTLLERRIRELGNTSGAIRHVADGMTKMIGKGTFMTAFEKAMDAVNAQEKQIELTYNDFSKTQKGEVTPGKFMKPHLT